MRRSLNSLLATVYLVIDRLISRSNHICFISFPDFEDNAFSYFKYLMSRVDAPACVWLTSDRKSTKSELVRLGRVTLEASKRVQVVRKYSLLGFFLFIRARRVFFTHGHYSFVRPGRAGLKFINLWHGMPLKAIGGFERINIAHSQTSDLTICSAEFFKPVMAHAFDISDDKVLVTGLPRCDVLFSCSEDAKIFKHKLTPNGKLIFWLPTYNLSNIGDIRNDSTASVEHLIRQFFRSLQELSNISLIHKVHIAVKIHPMDFLNDVEIHQMDGISVFSKANPLPSKIRLYEALSVADGLITDMSSISFDFMATRKPILITRWFFDSYARNLCFDPNLLFNAAYTCNCWDEAESFFCAVQAGKLEEGDDTDVFCQFKDAQSCERLEMQLISLAKSIE